MSGTATKHNFVAEVTKYQETGLTTSPIWIWFSKDKEKKNNLSNVLIVSTAITAIWIIHLVKLEMTLYQQMLSFALKTV